MAGVILDLHGTLGQNKNNIRGVLRHMRVDRGQKLALKGGDIFRRKPIERVGNHIRTADITGAAMTFFQYVVNVL